MATFFVVATPIGNLEDITARALKTLSSVDVIFCEDTRTTRKLLAYYKISTPTKSYHTHSTAARADEVVQLLREGKNCALVSDAGTPGISDPGAELVSQIRRELAEEISAGANGAPDGISIVSIPGPSAVVAALAIAGVPCASFTFLGFLPHKKGRQTLFAEIATSPRTTVFYESPHRITKTLESLVGVLAGDSGARPKSASPKRVTICRELTKIFEQVVQGSAEEVRAYFETNTDKIKGEFVVIVSE